MSAELVPAAKSLKSFGDTAERLVALVEPVSRWLEGADDAVAVDDYRAQAAALALYAEARGYGTAAVGAAQTIERRAEMALGRIFEKQKGGRGKKLLGASNSLPPDERSVFRKLEAKSDVVEAAIAELAPKGEATRSAILSAVKHAAATEGRQADQSARQIALVDHPGVAEGKGWRLFGDYTQRYADLPAGCVDLIVTDPPYAAEFLPLYDSLGVAANHLLTDDGIAVVLTGKILLDQVIAMLGAHLTYGWVYCQPLPGANSRIMARHVLQSWKPWLAFTKNKWPSGRVGWHPDMLDPSYRAKDAYRWQQDPDPAKLLIDALCPEGGTVCDPYAGTGAYGRAALEMGRQFIGFEIDSQRFAHATEVLNGTKAA